MTSTPNTDLVFVPFGGVGEIGMNLALYGYGPPRARKWLMVDCGLGFPGSELPGIDVVYPDIAFVEKIAKDVVAICITHAHEDHIGALVTLWPKLKCRVYATPFAAGLLEVKRLNEPGAPSIDIRPVHAGAVLDLDPFTVEYVAVAHSIPEANALAITTPLGRVVHTGDWKIDPEPGVGNRIDEARLRALGEEGVDVLICDSTNILREGDSFSESDVARVLQPLIAEASGRVVITTFASNVARLRAIAEAAQACGRTVVVAGRAMDRVVQVARDCGYLDGLPGFHSPEMLPNLQRDKTVVIATGSQGEPRAAMMRASQNDHPSIKLGPGDRVIFSSRAIPGNAREVHRVINNLCNLGVEVITDHDHLVHCSGHPRRGEVAQMYEWVRPKSAVPVHGEAHHLTQHVAFAKSRGVEHALSARDGDMVQLLPGPPTIVNRLPHGRLLKDGDVVLSEEDGTVRERNKLAFAGVVSVALAVDKKGDLVGDPDVVFAGVPKKGKFGEDMGEVIDEALFATFDGLPRARRRDPDTVSTAIERSLRGAIYSVWGKKPIVHVMVVSA
ncbi:ribonuclease J [Methylocystis iwaonis]|uniref:RNase J family beta-CASP ribonuclease n=1 Tax=Methylocystis iwaonis TaxID=2885079 RepID=A0ABN6VKE1_9HYPH|nr:ribonuclease J [Methylocystis iwaonis]BDV34832.1 RNase J family beta-CASP ribonuclease [Methylocystis iwaonis]